MRADRARAFEHQRRVLLLETLYDAALTLPTVESEQKVADEVLNRAVAVLDAARGFLAIQAEGGGIASRSLLGFSVRNAEKRILEEPFLKDVEKAGSAVARGPMTLLRTPVANALGVAIGSEGGSLGWLVLADKESRRAPASFGAEDGGFLSSIAALASVAIERRRHVSRLEVERRRLEEENRRLRDETGRAAGSRLLVGESPAVRKVLDLVARAAPTSVSVLVTGESGTGKELVARLIHEKSARKSAPFIPINCASLPESLLESELFGIERGVATGVEARPGKFELADGGTIFLDEIGDMPLALQAKILRVLQERETERIGSRRRIPLDIRIVSATNVDVARRVAAKEFREDLYYRLRVVEIALPALRERREDIPRLIRYFLERFAAREGTAAPAIDRGAMAALLSHPFPGNVRELENILEGAAALARGGVVRREDLQWITAPGPAEPVPSGSETETVSLRALEERHIQRVLRLAKGNKSRAARMLGIDRRTLYRKKM